MKGRKGERAKGRKGERAVKGRKGERIKERKVFPGKAEIRWDQDVQRQPCQIW